MIHLKQEIGGHFAGKAKLASKEAIVGMSVPTPNQPVKRGRKIGHPPRTVQTALSAPPMAFVAGFDFKQTLSIGGVALRQEAKGADESE